MISTDLQWSPSISIFPSPYYVHLVWLIWPGFFLVLSYLSHSLSLSLSPSLSLSLPPSLPRSLALSLSLSLSLFFLLFLFSKEVEKQSSELRTNRIVRIYSMNGGVRVYITARWEVWAYTPWMVVWEFTSHNNERCETILHEWWCVRLHHITMRSVSLYTMNGGVRVYITARWEVWDYTPWMVVCEFTSHNNEKCETILHEWWCVSLHHITMRSVDHTHAMNGCVRVYITSGWEVWDYAQWMRA